MSLSVDNIKLKYPLPAYNYRVSVLSGTFLRSTGGIKLDELSDKITVISCTEVSGLQMEIDSVVYRHGLSFLTGFHIVPGAPKEIQLSMKGGVTRDGTYLSDWMNISYPFLRPIPQSLVRKRDLLVDLCDEHGKPVVRWTILKALPVKLVAPTFQADTSEVAFEQLDLIAHELKVEYDL